MSTRTFDTRDLNEWLRRLRAGDASAREELITAAFARLERLARLMLRGFPNIPRRFADTDDIFQGAACRLLNALPALDPPPASVAAFYAVAASCIRGELLDLARRLARQRRRGDREAVPLAADSDDSGPQARGPADNPEELERWSCFHQEVEQLPAEEREVVGLRFYHGWTEEQIAELLGVSVRTVRRRWASAAAKLFSALGGATPEP